ncbi:hypothetical protein L0Y59_03710 [Candidatus Uhrbacteria bacterium]|nr:hypothetical protein [Candidatus Uhrbacteria bacterium]
MSRYPRPYAEGIELSNAPIWGKRPDGTPKHATIPTHVIVAANGANFPELFAAIARALEEDADLVLERNGAEVLLKDFEGDLVLKYCDADIKTLVEAILLMSEPSEEEIGRYASRVTLTEKFDEDFRKAMGRDPTPNERDLNARKLAKRDALDREDHQLLGLPDHLRKDIEDGRLDVYVVGPRSKASAWRHKERRIPLRDLAVLAFGNDPSKPKKGPPKTYKAVPKRYPKDKASREMHLTAPFDDTFRWVCYVERAVDDRRGLVIAFPWCIIREALKTKHVHILRSFPNELQEDLHPPCRWQEPRPRPHGYEGRRRHDAPAPPREVTDAKEPSPPMQEPPTDAAPDESDSLMDPPDDEFGDDEGDVVEEETEE